MEEQGYNKIAALGRGTYGTVFLCKNRLKQKCVIKQITLPQKNHKVAGQFIEMVIHEIYLLENLQHPRIIRLIDHFLIDNGNYICIGMEYAKHGTLKQMIATNRSHRKFFEQSTILTYFCDILLGLEYLHIKNIIHRDLKTENILLDRNMRIKIADFGIASVNWNNSKSNEPIGTPFYMPPETLQNNEFSFASDIWALGCILYEFCMLGHPYGTAKNKQELLTMTIKRGYISLKYGLKSYDSGMENLIKMQLEPDKKKRATISKLICDPLVMRQYYENYFRFEI